MDGNDQERQVIRHMKLKQLTERVWIFPYEEERDRPNLGYIRGDRWSLAVDAGHSDAHVAEFYGALEEAGLPLPQLTVLTHWHWDHTFALHATHGLSLANVRTNQYLREYRDRIERNGPEEFLALDGSIRREYAGNRPVKVIPADLEFTGEMTLDTGNCPVRIFQAAAPHTDDSTLIEVSGEKVLFIGDSACDEFMTGEKDPTLVRKLAEAIRTADAETCVEGHWIPCPVDDTLREQLPEETEG